MSFLLWYNNRNINRNTIYLSLFFIVVSIYGMTHFFTIYHQSIFWLAIFYSHFTPLMLLMGPFIYFYVRNTLEDRQGLKKIDYLHFIPATIHFIGLIPYYFKSFSHKEEIARKIIANLDILPQINSNMFYSAVVGYSMRPLFMMCYILYCLYMLWGHYRNRKNTNTSKTKQSFLTYRWLLILNLSILLLVTNFIVLTIKGIIEDPSDALLTMYPLHIISALAYFTMVFSLLFFPNILYGIPIPTKLNEPVVKPVKEKEIEKKVELVREKQDLLKLYNEDDSLYEVAVAIKQYLLDKEPYLDPEFSQFTISVDLKIPLNHISYCFAYIFKKKFNLLRMELRVNYAMKLLKQGLTENITIDAISQEAGFSSRSNFYAAFKKITNSTPSEFVVDSSKNLTC
ncbi:helix-turn-helix domain-containing protein [Flavobacterium sp. SUN046]|uniref:AraC family transcriptional regulator n=1 Tax=Flavobacterium sp. SUN046 TaxID=3002440 RepID=UPI002DBDEFCB|nr:helix-turn-helix domain-containing protein [Flavobacterium sp. SUN046]MEC4050333.1 helix-turn-helix domain-containing protein [Flavobacterium sp. SUN046]